MKRFGLEEAGAKERVEGLRRVPAGELLEFAVAHGVMGGWGGTIEEGGLWERTPEKLFLAGEWDRGVEEWVLGTNEDEGTLFVKALKVRYFRVVHSRTANPLRSSKLPPPLPPTSLALPPRPSSNPSTPPPPPQL